MASDISVGRGDLRAMRQAQTEELNSTQDQFLERKAALNQQHETELRRIREANQRSEQESREAGAASVNHIKKATSEKIEQTELQAKTKLDATSDQAAKEYASLKQRARLTRDSLSGEVDSERERSRQTLESLRDNQTKAIQESQNQLKKSLQEQQQQQTQLHQRSRLEYEESQSRASKALSESKQKNQTDLRKEIERGRSELDAYRTKEQQTLDETRRQANSRLTLMRADQQKQIEGERAEGNRALNDLRTQSQIAYKQTRDQGELRRGQLEVDQDTKLRESREQYLKTNEETNIEYSKETQRIQKLGEMEIENRKHRNEEQLAQQEHAFKAESQARIDEQRALEAKDQAILKAKAADRDRLHEALLQELDKDFQKRYVRADDVNKSSLQNQREQYLRALYRQQQEFGARFDKVESRQDDPFYKLQSFEARLEEGEGSYTIRARIPPHERDRVEIRVKDGRAVLSASRQHEEKLGEKGNQASSHTMQTWRQEFALKLPVYRDGVIKEVLDDGSITVTIPKKA